MDNNLFQNKYRIPSARAYWHNYNNGCYFITICTDKREHFFGEIINGEMIASELGLQASLLLNNINTKYKDASIISFVVMPNHVHFIIDIHGYKKERHDKGKDNNTDINETMSSIAKKRGRLSVIISKFKTSLSKYANRNDIPFAWQSRFHDRIIRDHEELITKENYIRNNISKWKEDEFY